MKAHGGDARAAAEEIGLLPFEILDFSANINPRGLPPRALERLISEASDQRLLGLYPDPSAPHLRRALSNRLTVPAEAIVVGPGAEALMTPILRSLGATHALVPVPAFSEYKRVCLREGIQYTAFAMQREDHFRLQFDRFRQCIETGNFDVVILNNPHNPSGWAIDKDQICSIFEVVSARRGTLLLDEAFIDYVPGASLTCTAAERDRLIVLRSLTKFYGCPALRIGYAVAAPETVKGIASFLPTWPITEMAAAALTEALADENHVNLSLAENVAERERLSKTLSALGLTVFPSAANYLLVELGERMPNSTDLRARMLERHRLLVRNCDSFEGLEHGRFVRVAVRTTEENERLTDALREELGVR